MTTQAQYNLSTGLIQATITGKGITDANQISALQTAGIGLVSVPDGSNFNTGMIIDGAYVSYNPPAQSIPNIGVQLAAALINNGTVPVSAFHQATIAQINSDLSASGLTAVAAVTAAP